MLYIKHKETGEFLSRRLGLRRVAFNRTNAKIYFNRGTMFNSLRNVLRDYHWNKQTEEIKAPYKTSHHGVEYYLEEAWWTDFRKGKSFEELLPQEWELKEWNPE